VIDGGAADGLVPRLVVVVLELGGLVGRPATPMFPNPVSASTIPAAAVVRLPVTTKTTMATVATRTSPKCKRPCCSAVMVTEVTEVTEQ